jgi:hypothetical protein
MSKRVLREDRRIYVQVPSYRDSELANTLLSLYQKAEHPEWLRVCVVWQRAEDETLPLAVRRLPGLELLEVPYWKSRGCNWARYILQEHWRGEPYTLLIDSHHRFVFGFDTLLVELHSELRGRSIAKPLLTAYLPAYQPDREPGGRRKQPYKIYPFGRESGLLTSLTSHPIPQWKKCSGPIEADFLSLHLLFVEGDFNREIRFHPGIYFVGDEVLTSLRAYTQNYDLYHPHIVLGWHCYDRTSRVPHWADHETWYERHRRSLQIMRHMFRGTYRGPYGLGSSRNIRDYENHIGIKLIEEPAPQRRAVQRKNISR